ncbi:MAG: hypothetical protein HY908_19085 [Myxococcales bacterium]|nr:hypothetical protein [Myxococcales bacterium]
MPYRDDRASLRAQNERLEVEVQRLRTRLDATARLPGRRRWLGRVARGAAAALVPVVLVVAALTQGEPARATTATPPAPLEAGAVSTPGPAVAQQRPRQPSGLAELATARGGAAEGIARVYDGVVTHVSAGGPVAEGERCRVALMRAGTVCFVDASCGAWSPTPPRSITVCDLDERGFPHGGIHMASTTGQPTQVTMEGTRFELADERAGRDYLVTLRLDDVRPEPLPTPLGG